MTSQNNVADNHARRVRVALVQAGAILFDTPKSLEKLADLAGDAAKQEAQLAIFPEAFIGGYFKGHDFGVSIGMRSAEGRDEFRRLFESAIDIPGPATVSSNEMAARFTAPHRFSVPMEVCSASTVN